MAGVEHRSRDDFIYRICPDAEWKEAKETGGYCGGDLDKRDGFIHMSTSGQVAGTLARIFAGRDDLSLLKIDTRKIKEGLLYEQVKQIGEFPHYYGPSKTYAPMPLEAVTERRRLVLVDGKHALPF